MRITHKMMLTGGLALLTPFLTAHLSAQIANQVEANIPHQFIVSTKTLPAGNYVFQMNQGSDLEVMTVSSADGKNSDQFMVRESIAPKTPAHTELVFNRYGDQEFLNKVYEGGNKTGVAVMEPSKMEKELQAQGQHPVTHSEFEVIVKCHRHKPEPRGSPNQEVRLLVDRYLIFVLPDKNPNLQHC